ncbi:MAG TPA: hypothetical protein VK177_01325 [Flavobacteriales bacterium]|nr:hypothetical protein [Flavobacteriales bacterium]
MNQVALPYADIVYEEPIVYFTFKENTELGFPEIRELIAVAEKLADYKPYFTLSDVRVNINITEEGKRVVDDIKNMPYFRGTAAIVKNNMYKYGANFMANFNRRNYPFRAFTNKEKAVEWLLSLPRIID